MWPFEPQYASGSFFVDSEVAHWLPTIQGVKALLVPLNPSCSSLHECGEGLSVQAA